jgi:DNA-binding MarR family transcriptional regulator
MRYLTAKQSAIVSFIATKLHDNGRPPTIRELCTEFNVRSTNGMAEHLKAIEKKGYIVRSDGARGLRLTPLSVSEVNDACSMSLRADAIYSTAATLLDLIPNNPGNKVFRDGILRIMRIVSGDEDHSLLASQVSTQTLCKGTEKEHP